MPEEVRVTHDVNLNLNVKAEDLADLLDSLTDNVVIVMVAFTACSLVRRIVKK